MVKINLVIVMILNGMEWTQIIVKASMFIVHESQNLHCAFSFFPLPLFIRVREKEDGQYILVCFVIHHQIIYQIINIWKSSLLKLQNKNFKNLKFSEKITFRIHIYHWGPAVLQIYFLNS